MKKRSKAATKTSQSAPRKGVEAKGPKRPPRPCPSRGAAPARETEVARLTRERDEALEQQTATSEVSAGHQQLSGRSCSRCSTAMLEKAIRICEAELGRYIYRWDGQNLRVTAVEAATIPVT